MSEKRAPSTTTRKRIILAFSAVLALFAIALVVMLLGLSRIAAAETEVARLDHAKHAGHQAAALAREQYIHQAHTLIEWNESHLGHYAEVARAARKATETLRSLVTGHDATAQADEIARLVVESDRRFRDEVVPAIGTVDRSHASELHQQTEAIVEKVVDLNEALNATLEEQSDAAQARAEQTRRQARILVVACFGLAILLAAAVGAYLVRSISRPIAALRAGVERVGTGDLDHEIALAADDEFSELARAFNQMTGDLSRHQAELLEAHRLASIGQVASGVAHEINNPLGVILGYTKVLRSDPALHDRDELTIIEDELRQCQRIVAGLLDLARPVKLAIADVDLGDVVREAAARLDESGKSEGVTIAIDGAADAMVRADEAKLRQVVVNLLLNAVEAARDEHARAPTVEVRWTLDRDRAVLEVLDQGPGIPADVAGRLFEPFFTTKAQGHGLGLAIARTIAQAHRGDIVVEPRQGEQGTRAALLLPRRITSGRAAA